jgi:uncharacterized protein (DUF362 family)
MTTHRVAIVRYQAPDASVRRAVDLAGGLPALKPGARVLIKPNIVYWTRSVPFPKWGMITTSRVVEDMVTLLKARGVDRITIAEGVVTADPRDAQTPAHAFATLGYDILARRYGVKIRNVMEGRFAPVDLGGGVTLKFCAEALESDLIVDLPVLKAHNQTMVSLGIKNLKGLIDIPSRKKCHRMDPGADLHAMVARLADGLPPVFTLIDGIYSCERGPAFDGKMHRSDLLIASRDVLSADLVGARVLGHEPAAVPHLAHAARNHGRPLDLSDVQVVGEPIAAVARFHAYDFDYGRDAEGNWLPVALLKQGIRGLSYPKYDLSMCTYCSGVNGVVLTAIRHAWKGEPFDDVEILTGKAMAPSPGKKKTILLGKCMYQAHRDNPAINEMIAVKGCPPKPDQIVAALHRAGIGVDPALFAHMDQLAGFFMARYQGKPEFDEAFFRVAE